jgi:hypothetical protein
MTGMIRIKFRSAIILLLISLIISACSDAPLSPEEQLSNILKEAETYLEARDLTSAMGFVDPDYQDKTGRDFRALKAMLLGYLMRHKSIHIFSKVDTIDIHTANEAEAVVFAGLAATPQERDLTPAQWRGDLLRLELRFKRRDDDWLLHTAQWRRAMPEDFAF